jgi:hypothetical protein
LVFLLQRLTELCKKSPRCTHAMQLLHSSIPSDMNKPPKVGVSGWKTIKAQFEDNQSSYSVSDNGTMYTSVHSNNTCGIINTPFGKNSRAAWEFQLESDTLNDECSVFGAARIPESPGTLNRCYSTSPDLWMRRAYNGYMYVQGRTTGNNMEKIHPSHSHPTHPTHPTHIPLTSHSSHLLTSHSSHSLTSHSHPTHIPQVIIWRRSTHRM